MMKNTAIALATLAAALLAVSCQKDSGSAANESAPMTIQAYAEGIRSAKTDLVYTYDIIWRTGDQLYATDGKNSDTFTLSAGAGTPKGTFVQDGSVSFSGAVDAFYPKTIVQGGSLTWPSLQSANPVVPMYCRKNVVSKTEEFDFKSLGSVLQIVFTTKQTDVTLRSIEVKDGQKTMSGTFTVDAGGKAVITSGDKAGITLDLGTSGVKLGAGANYFNIAVPAADYLDFSLVFTATDGRKCVFTNGQAGLVHNVVGQLLLTGEFSN